MVLTVVKPPGTVALALYSAPLCVRAKPNLQAQMMLALHKRTCSGRDAESPELTHVASAVLALQVKQSIASRLQQWNINYGRYCQQTNTWWYFFYIARVLKEELRLTYCIPS